MSVAAVSGVSRSATRFARTRRIIKAGLVAAGLLFLVQILVAVIGPPAWLTDWLNAKELGPRETPRYVIVLGGGGIPSGSGLLRTYVAVEAGVGWTGATFIVSLPTDEDPQTSSVGRMRDELVRRGIPSGAILMEYRGRNTHEQAVRIRELLPPGALNELVTVVTSDYHLRRAVLCFRREGFTRVAGVTAFGTGAEIEPGAWAVLRYGFWKNLERQATITRELVALLAYKLRGWI
ncbi:YdcF family protein [bacterium]|nr:YdcF family protein [bacterium]